MKTKDWFICIFASIGTLLVLWLVMYGLWAIFVDTMRAIIH